MAIDLRAVGSVFNDSASTGIIVPVPAGTQDGDQLIAVIGAILQTTITPPAGWTLIQAQDAGANLRVWSYRRLASGEPANYTWTLASSTKNHGIMLGYTGVDSTSPVTATSGTSSSGTSHASPAVTVPNEGWLITHVAARHVTTGAATTWTTSDGSDAERADHGSTAGSQDISGAVYDSARALSAGSASRTLTSSQSESLIALQSIALTPAVLSTVVPWIVGVPL
jgi:hypothetical protein